MLQMLVALAKGVAADSARMSPTRAGWRALRAMRHLLLFNMLRRLLSNAAYRRHVALVNAVERQDALFFVNHYLARGLTLRQRVAAALHHYRHEVNAFKPGYFEAVYRGDGLLLWRAETPQGEFDIVLVPGADVLHEGGVSVIARFNGERICVMSYCTVPVRMVLPASEGADAEKVLFIARKQMSAEHGYQAGFNKAFDRSMPAHFCFAALSGVAMAQGQRRVFGIAPAANPSCNAQREQRFNAAYRDFWESLGGRATSPYGFEIDLPMALTPLERMDAKARKRAVARRAHLEAVQDSAMETVGALLATAPSRAAALQSTQPEATTRCSQGALLFCALMPIACDL